MTSPKVAVVVPVRDRRALLRETLDALAAQSYRDFEVVVVDDGSVDGSREEALKDEALGRHVRVVTGPGTGAVAARIAGVATTSAEILAFTDSDCIPAPNWLAAGVAALERGADVVQGRTIPVRPPGPLERTVTAHDDGLFATCNVFYRRASYEAAGGFDTTAAVRLRFRPDTRARRLGFGEDVLLGWRVARRGRRAYAEDAVVAHHVFPFDLRESLSRAAMAGAFPALVREVPELRVLLLRHRVVLGDRSRLALLAAAGAIVTRRPRWAALALGWWIAARARAHRDEPSWRRRGLAIASELMIDGVTEASLLAGSGRARSLVV